MTAYTTTVSDPPVVGERSSLSLALPAGTVTPPAADAEGGLVTATVWPMTNAEIQYGDHDGFGQYQPYGWLSSENPTIGLALMPKAAGAVSASFTNDAGLTGPARVAGTAGRARTRTSRCRPGLTLPSGNILMISLS